ncbi:hypothetical protein [Winogradskyella rapida]|uniref:Uncharacterized protein n=1 Tax=Winogradskyella rapida TaxID=549701 RepID=A0ABW3KSZ3_9FLAO
MFHTEKASRTNSTFGFCRHESQHRKTKRAVFCQRLNDIEKKELNLKTDKENILYGIKNLETTKGNK